MGEGKKIPTGWKKEDGWAPTACLCLWKWQKVPSLLPKKSEASDIVQPRGDCRMRSSSLSLVESCSLSPALLHTSPRTHKSKTDPQENAPSTPPFFWVSSPKSGTHIQLGCPIMKADIGSQQRSPDCPVSPGAKNNLAVSLNSQWDPCLRNPGMAWTDLKWESDTIMLKKLSGSHHVEKQGWEKETLSDSPTGLKSFSHKWEAIGFSGIPQHSWHLTVMSVLEV